MSRLFIRVPTMRGRRGVTLAGRRPLLVACLCLCLGVGVSAAAVATPAMAAHDHGKASQSAVVYRPADPAQFSGYPRIVRLAHHGRANGTLVATFDTFADNHDSLLVYHSTDNGASWTRIATVADKAYSGRTCCATLYEVPRRLGALPAGTLLLGASEGAAGTVGHEIKVFRSGDGGHTWTYLSSCARGDGGLWEPNFQIDRAGRLACYFSDERRVAYSQFLGHVVSTNGGRTWGPEHVDIAVPDGVSRPGMATVIRLPDGRYMMSFEVCSPANCAVHVKTSANGDDWGQASDLGSRVQTADGRYGNHTPYLTWVPIGGPHGELLLTSKEILGSDGIAAPQSGSDLFVNRRDGSGPWSLIPAPVQLSVEGEPDCANYSSALLPSPSGDSLAMIAAASLDAGGCEIRYGRTTLQK